MKIEKIETASIEYMKAEMKKRKFGICFDKRVKEKMRSKTRKNENRFDGISERRSETRKFGICFDKGMKEKVRSKTRKNENYFDR